MCRVVNCGRSQDGRNGKTVVKCRRGECACMQAEVA